MRDGLNSTGRPIVFSLCGTCNGWGGGGGVLCVCGGFRLGVAIPFQLMVIVSLWCDLVVLWFVRGHNS
jgi:hypothetical protein